MGSLTLVAVQQHPPSVRRVARVVVPALVVPALVLPALAVTLARLLPGDTVWWVILRALTPVAILPYAVAVIVLAASARGLTGSPRTTVLSSLAVVGALLVLHVWWFVGPSLADAPGSPTDDTVVVMTANLHIGQADARAVLDAVDRHGVDVLVLEEITPTALAALDAAGVGRRLGHRAGEPRTDRDGTMVLADGALGTVTPIPTSSPGLAVEMTTDRGPLRILAVHPIAPNNGVAQWSSDLELVVDTARGSQGPTVVAGDFNATLDHPHLRHLMGSGYRDSSAGAGLGWRPTWPVSDDVRLGGLGLPPLFALDHVFVRGPLEPTEVHLAAVRGTDHRALVTRIAWTE